METAHWDANETFLRFEQVVEQLQALNEDALEQAIAATPNDLVGELLTALRHRLRGKRADQQPGAKVSARSRRRLDEYERGAEHERRVREDGHKDTDEEWEEWSRLYHGAVGDIAMGGIENGREATALNTAITLALAELKFTGSVDDAVDCALCIAFDEVHTNEIAWLIALARFRLRGFGAPPWVRPAPQLLG